MIGCVDRCLHRIGKIIFQTVHIFLFKYILRILAATRIVHIMLQHIHIRIFQCRLCLLPCTGAQIIHDCIGTVEILLRTALDFLHLDIHDRDLCDHHCDRADNHHEY